MQLFFLILNVTLLISLTKSHLSPQFKKTIHSFKKNLLFWISIFLRVYNFVLRSCLLHAVRQVPPDLSIIHLKLYSELYAFGQINEYLHLKDIILACLFVKLGFLNEEKTYLYSGLQTSECMKYRQWQGYTAMYRFAIIIGGFMSWFINYRV